jgi:predicted nucleotidyltransferase
MNVKDWLDARTIYLARHGSHAYGTALPTSDRDLRGIAVPPREYLLGCVHHFEQAEQKGDPDIVIFDLRKFMNLAADCNPNVLEILFVEPEDRLTVTPAAELLLAQRQLFLSKKARHTFSGYAMSQLKRIETHRRWLLDPPKAPPVRQDFGLPERSVLPKDQLAAAESLMRKQVDAWQLDLEPLDEASKIQFQDRLARALAEMSLAGEDAQVRSAGRLLGYDDNFLDLLDRERRYTAAARQWESYVTWVKTRNPARAELEARHGYDSKHGMHLVRLMRMCAEILTSGQVRVRRPDAEELLAIRRGAWSYETLMEWARKQDAELEACYKSSPLPHSPDRKAIDALCVRIVDSMLGAGS